MQEVIKVGQLTKSYGELTAVENISLSVDRGMVFGLLGANGAGKSTTIECILGTKKADRGIVRILGTDPLKDRKKLFEKVGVQFQESSYQEQSYQGFIRRAETASVHCSGTDTQSGSGIFGRTDYRTGCKGAPGGLEDSFRP